MLHVLPEVMMVLLLIHLGLLASPLVEELDNFLNQLKGRDHVLQVPHAIRELGHPREQGGENRPEVVLKLVRAAIEEVSQICEAKVYQLDRLDLVGVLHLILFYLIGE